MSHKEILGLIATAIAFVSYIPYFRDILAHRTKPHAFSWFVWGILTLISFASQISDDAGPGAWVSGFTAVIGLVIFFFALKVGKRNIARSDWLMLAGAGLALLMWFITKTPLLSVILITIVDFFGFLPTIRKSYDRPYEETLSTFALSGLKYVVAIFALDNVSVITALYPIYLIGANAFFITLLYVRRKQVDRVATSES